MFADQHAAGPLADDALHFAIRDDAKAMNVILDREFAAAAETIGLADGL